MMSRHITVHLTLLLVFLAMPVVASTGAGTVGATPEHGVVQPVPPDGDETFVPETTARCGTGILQVLGDDGPIEREFPLEHTRVDATVTGVMSRVEVTQTFANPFDETIEAVYVFPLPHEAAVTDLQMTLGERVIRGVIDRREAARRIYEQARQDGHVAALLEQERPNIFTQSVANILPGNRIEIRITYIEQLEPDAGMWEFAFPMVVGPRYIPQGAAPSDMMPVSTDGKPLPPVGPGNPDRTFDAERLNPPFLPPSLRSGHDIELTLQLDIGAPIGDLRSPTHAFVQDTSADGAVRIRLHPADTIPNKDFVVRWDVEGDGPEAAVLTYHDGTQGYVSVVVHPRTELRNSDITAKEMVFVLDCSGSMRGEPMAAAKALARRALLDMRPNDSFQIIRFSTGASGFSPSPVAATPQNVRRGLAYLESLAGSGGTEMIQGIRAALDYPSDPERLRIVVFLTDGYIGNENEILAAIRERIGAARLFSFGVGSAVNRFLLEEMAREGRGQVAFQLPGSRAAELVETFYRRMRHPYLTDVTAEWRGVEVLDPSPQRIPDLFAGGALVLRGRYEAGGDGELRLRGLIAGRPWEKKIALDLPQEAAGNPAIGSLWARGRIADLERTMLHGENSRTVEEITRIALNHRLVTEWTSFVAVEEKMVVSDGNPQLVRVPVDLPQGVSHEGVFGTKGEGLASTRPVHRASSGSWLQKGLSSLSMFGMRGAPPSTPAPATPQAAVEREESATSGEPRQAVDLQALDLPMADALKIGMTARVQHAGSGDRIQLRITFFNGGSTPVLVPRATRLPAERMGLRVIGAEWRETVIGPQGTMGVVGGLSGFRSTETMSLAPGAHHVIDVDIPVTLLGDLGEEGVVHLLLDGRRWGSPDTPRVSVTLGGK